MDFQNYQKMLQSTPHSNGFPLMTYFPQQFQQQIYQQQKSQFQFQQSMIPFPFNPMNNFGNYQNFMNCPQQQQFQQKCHNQFQLPRPTALCLPPSFSTTSAFNRSSLMMQKKNLQQLSNSENESATKDETPREIFFKTLSSSLKEANKFYSGKTTSWKNPFLYKTHLCENFCNRQYCRFGVNCWYAHGPHELRCIPNSNELPDADFMAQYLSFLGLPSQTLEQIIQYAYYVANLLTSSESPWFSLSKSSFPDLPSVDSLYASNSPNSDIPSESINTQIISKSKRDKFYSSYISNGSGGWAKIESAINGNNVENSDGNEKHFEKSYRLFGASCNLPRQF